MGCSPSVLLEHIHRDSSSNQDKRVIKKQHPTTLPTVTTTKKGNNAVDRYTSIVHHCIIRKVSPCRAFYWNRSNRISLVSKTVHGLLRSAECDAVPSGGSNMAEANNDYIENPNFQLIFGEYAADIDNPTITSTNDYITSSGLV
ncbi:hypothetical protein Trydic_g11635 [Trypoxylus dichotomus]